MTEPSKDATDEQRDCCIDCGYDPCECPEDKFSDPDPSEIFTNTTADSADAGRRDA